MAENLWLIRHGETEWSLSGAHTGRTDIPLTAHGRELAQQVGQYLAGRKFALVLSSPLSRAVDTCRLAGYGEQAQVEPLLQEWNYGDYEGKSTPEIRKTRPDWFLWRDGVPNGETVEQVGVRADAVIARIASANGDVALFSHGHFLRIFTARWLGLEASGGRLFALDTATISVLGFERETHVMKRWNMPTV
jgi:broad specificity phosphatase PhoE